MKKLFIALSITAFAPLYASATNDGLPSASNDSSINPNTPQDIVLPSAAWAKQIKLNIAKQRKETTGTQAIPTPVHSSPDNTTESIPAETPVITPLYTKKQLDEMIKKDDRYLEELSQIKAQGAEERARNPEKYFVLTPKIEERISTLMKEMTYNSAKKYAFAIGSTILGVITLKAVLDWYFKAPAKKDRTSRFFANSTIH